MKIIRDEGTATITLVATNAEETEALKNVITISKPRKKMSYGGCVGKDGGRPFAIYLHMNSRRKRVVEEFSNVTMRSTKLVGGAKLEILGTTEADDQEVRSMRDTCFFGSTGFFYLGSSDVGGEVSIIITAQFCKHCHSYMISRVGAEWKTCDACAEKCRHKYIRGTIHGGSAGNLAMGEYCRKCGRVKPELEGARKKGQIERELEVERELGIQVRWKGESPFVGPRHFAEVDRLMRRHARASTR